MNDGPIVIVGGGLAAARAVKGYREGGGQAPVTMLSADTALPYHRPPLSKGFLRGEIDEDKVLVEPESFYAENGVDVRLSTRVTGVDVESRQVETDAGGRIGYERLVLASGSVPRRLGVPGEDLEGVHLYRTLADAKSVRGAAADARRAVVVGGSFIGMETTASLTRSGVGVTQLERSDGLFAALRAPEVSRSLARLYETHGVEVLLGEAIGEFRGRAGRLTGAVTASGREIEADLGIVGVGVTPSLDFLDGSAIDVDDGVVVNERFETSVEGVYAVGDIARFHDPVFGHARRIEHWSNANHQGMQVGKLLAGEDAPYDYVALFFSEVFGVRLGLLGDLDGGHDELVLRGSIEEGALLGLYLRDGRLVAALLHNQDDETQARLDALLRAQARVARRDALSDQSVPPVEAFAS
jgi:3-phenylpropionate/trans-cinnamate dioxygenase ferredoxin reductase component